MMKLSREKLPDYFTIASPKNSHYTESVNCFDFVDRGSKILLVTVGESWTWGSELANRLDEVFGNLISKQKHWDWLNLAQPGSSNFFIAERVEELSSLVDQLDYDQIKIVCVFTEIGRGFNSHHDMHIDYVSWLRNNVRSEKDFYRFMEMINVDCCNRILCAAQDRCQILFASSFVDYLGIPRHNVAELPWYKVLGVDQSQQIYSATTGVKRLESLVEFLQPGHLEFFKIWLTTMIDDAIVVDEICRTVGQGKNLSHPTALGHKIWADYLLQYIDTYEK